MEKPKNNSWTFTECLQCKKQFEVYKRQLELGKGKFCSQSCSTTYRNLTNNPTKKQSVRDKISKNHVDVSGKNNPMYGRKGKEAPGYIDGRNSYTGNSYRKIALANMQHKCSFCDETDLNKIHVHHKDADRRNNNIENLMLVCAKCHYSVVHTYNRDELGRFNSSELNKEVVL